MGFCQEQRAERHDILTQGGDPNGGSLSEGVHGKGLQMLLDRFGENRPEQRKSAAEDDYFGMGKMDDVGEAEREVGAGFIENLAGEGITGSESGPQVAGFGTGVGGSESGQFRFWILGGQLTDFSIDRPAGAAILNDGAGAVEAKVTDFRLAWDGSVVDGLIYDETTTDAAAHRDVEDRIVSASGPKGGFGERGGIGIVIHAHKALHQRLKPLREIEIGPALHLVGAADAAGASIHRAAESHPGTGEGVAGPFPEGGLDLLANAGTAPGGIHCEPLAVEDATVAIANDQLQLGAADFDPEILVADHLEGEM